jgi:hypothetical protein
MAFVGSFATFLVDVWALAWANSELCNTSKRSLVSPGKAECESVSFFVSLVANIAHNFLALLSPNCFVTGYSAQLEGFIVRFFVYFNIF